MPRTRLISIMPLLLIVATGACMAQPTPPTAATAQNRTLRVATGQTAPFVLDENGVLTGFSIDLWQELAGRLKREFVPAVSGTPFLSAAAAMVSSGIRQIALAALVIMFLLANVLWLVERRTHPAF